ncbi:MAG: Gfo/Idh/MocA family oxidoreductase [Nocardioides sp.]
MAPLRIGLVGAGPHAAGVIVPTIRSTPGLDLVAIGSSDASATELAGAWGIEGVQAEVAEFLSVGEFDAVVLASTPADHEAALALAPRLGLPLFVEAPASFGSAPLRTFTSANGALEKPVVSFVDLHLRYAAMTRVALEHIATHGRVFHVAMDCHTAGPRTGLWDRDLVDAFLLQAGVHPLGLMAELLGWPTADTLTGAEVTQTRKNDCFVSADFTTRTARGSLRMSNTRNHVDLSVTVLCQDGTSVAWTLDEVTVYSPASPAESRLACDPLLPGGERGGYAGAMREFRDACLGKAESGSSIERVLTLTDWIERLRSS